MKRTPFFAIGLCLFLGFTSCQSDDEEPVVSEDLNAEIISYYVDEAWSSTAELKTSLPNSSDTQFMNNEMSKNAGLWGQYTPTLRFVDDPVNPNSTYNAVSYSTGKIYYGYAIFADAKTRTSDNMVNAMILSHEYGHQLQYAYGIPSVRENTVRSSELQADGFAGLYLRMPAGFNQSDFYSIAAAYEFAAEIGDYSTTSPGHHGTPPQRRSAVRLGFLIGDALLNSNINNYSPVNFDNDFFYYYSGVLNGEYGASETDPVQKAIDASVNPEIAEYMAPYIEEIQNIKNGLISAEEWKNLK